MNGLDTLADSRLLTKFALTLICTAIVLGCSSNEPVVKKTETSPSIPVRTVAVATSQVQRATTQPASVHAYIQADIRSLATGYVSEVKVDIGDVVEAGAILAVIDVPELKQQ